MHAWREAEPYIGLLGASQDVRGRRGRGCDEVAHGDNEERILRIRHDNGLETMYGNLAESYVSEGDHVYAGDILGLRKMDSRFILNCARMAGPSIPHPICGKW